MPVIYTYSGSTVSVCKGLALLLKEDRKTPVITLCGEDVPVNSIADLLPDAKLNAFDYIFKISGNLGGSLVVAAVESATRRLYIAAHEPAARIVADRLCLRPVESA